MEAETLAPRRGSPFHLEDYPMSKLKIAIIIGTTRDARFGHVPAQYIYDLAKADPDIDAELVDLKSFDLPMFNELAANAWIPSSDPHAVAWQ